MPEYLSPGVYIEEIEIGGKPIEGVSTTTAGFLGQAERGPTRPRLITSVEQYRRLYGGFISSSYLPYAVDGFFRNGGKRCFIGRILGKNSRKASLEVSSQNSSTPSPSTPAAPDNTEGEDPKNAKSPPSGGSKKSKSSKTESGGNPGKAFKVEAIGPGAWGNRIGVRIEEARLSKRNPKLFKLTVMYWKTAPKDSKVVPIDPQPEVYDNLSCEPGSSDFYEKRLNNVSALIEVRQINDRIPAFSAEPQYLAGGSDGDKIGLSDYKGQGNANPGERTGLAAFTEVDEISMVCVPDEDDCDGLTQEIVNHCELMKDRFTILQASQSAGPISDLEPPLDSKYAAFYYPWIKVIDPQTKNGKLIPPGGHIAGIYARNDIERGVHKAPANEIVRGAIKLQFPLTSGDQDILNPRGVNCMRSFRGRGIRVWGARTVSSDSLWKYVNVRRLFLYLEESIEEGTQWVVFEPNDQRLWARVSQSVSDFLTRVWKDGALMGTTPDEAFFVKCDETTMTPDDINNGRLIVLIGVAPVKPAEFVIFRIAQWRSGSEITE